MAQEKERYWKDQSTSKTSSGPILTFERVARWVHQVRLYRGFVERGVAGEALFQRGDYCFHLRAERTLDHDGIAGANGGEDLRLKIRRAIGIAAAFAGGKGVPQVVHQRTTTI